MKKSLKVVEFEEHETLQTLKYSLDLKSHWTTGNEVHVHDL